MDVWDHIAATGEWGAEFRCTPLIVDILAQRKIFIGHIAPLVPGDRRIRFEENVAVEPYTSFPPDSEELCSMGAFSYSWTALLPGVRVGRYSSLAKDIKIFGNQHHMEYATTSPFGDDYLSLKEAHKDFNNGVIKQYPLHDHSIGTAIEHDVWIGSNVMLGRHITVGIGAVVGAGAIVTKDIAPYMIVGGNPARVIRPRFPEKIIERFLQSQWWTYDIRVLKACEFSDPEKFLDDFARWKESTGAVPYTPVAATFRDILNDVMDRL